MSLNNKTDTKEHALHDLWANWIICQKSLQERMRWLLAKPLDVNIESAINSRRKEQAAFKLFIEAARDV